MKKVVLITGASKGLGKSLCKLFLDNDYDVIGTYHNTFSSDTKIDYQQCDLSNKDDLKTLMDYIMNKYHHLDVLINNAALCLDNDYLHKSIEEFDNIFKVNVYAPFELIKLFAMTNQKGVVINISSTDAQDTYNSYNMDYSASKAALENLTKNYAKTLPNFKIMAIAPSWMNTETVLEMEPNFLNEEMKKHGQEELLDKNNVAKKIYEMVNSDKYQSGMIIRMDDDNEYR